MTDLITTPLGVQERLKALRRTVAQRIVVLDGASGSEFQNMGLTEDDLRGDRFVDHVKPLTGNYDLLAITGPEALRKLHRSYLQAGSDVISTNTFSSTTVAQREYGLDDAVLVREINRNAARIARETADSFTLKDGRLRWVAGAVGPTNVTLSLSPRVEDPGYRAITFAELAASYQVQIAGLIEGCLL